MPEHVHLLITEPERAKLSVALQMLKQNVARLLREIEGGSFWQARYYDFNVWTEAKRIEKLRYIHRNPVRRGLVASPELWAWGSFRHYLAGAEGVVQIESQWTARRRESLGMTPLMRVQGQNTRPPCRKTRDKDGAAARVESFSESLGQPPSSTAMSAWLCRSVAPNDGQPNNSSPQGQIFYAQIVGPTNSPYAVYAVDNCTGAENVGGGTVPGFYSSLFPNTPPTGAQAVVDDMIGFSSNGTTILPQCTRRTH